MKIQKIKSSQSGIALIDVIVALVIVAIATAFVMSRSERGDNAKLTKVISDDIADIHNAAISFKGTKPNYVGITMTQLTSQELLNTTWGDGTGINPMGGNYTVAATGSSSVNIVATGLSTGLCNGLQSKLSNSFPAVACAGTTLTVTAN